MGDRFSQGSFYLILLLSSSLSLTTVEGLLTGLEESISLGSLGGDWVDMAT